jgi:signal transduction histidine kinase
MDALALAVAAAVLVVGAAAMAVGRWRLGITASIVGLCLPALAYSGNIDAPDALVMATIPLVPALAPLAAWALLGPDRLLRVALAAGLVAGPLRALLYDPFYDPTCLTVCSHNPLAVMHLSSTANTVLWAGALLAAAALTGVSLRSPRHLAAGVLALAAWLLALRPDDAVAATVLTAGVILAVGGGSVARDFEARARVADLARALQSAADVEATLRSEVGDAGITVSYPLAVGSGYLNRDGRPATPLATGQASTEVNGPEGVVARVDYNPDVTSPATLAAAISGPARLALDNGRLGAMVSHQADAIAASRRRIVTHADSERRRLERDLHDGAQQHVLALGLALRTALDTATDPKTQDVLHRCLATTHVVLGELRDLSHGFYPASLAQTGLGNALDGIADSAPVPVSVTSLPDERMPAEIEQAIYLFVSRVAASAQRPLEVAITRTPRGVDVVAVGARTPEGVLADVFAVLGGTLDGAGDGAGADAPMVRGWLPLLDRTRVEVS